jgi:ribonucleoside-diphosphate reductase alpha chain
MSRSTSTSRKKAQPVKTLAGIGVASRLDQSQNRYKKDIDPVHQKVAWFGQDLVQQIWADKYRYLSEQTPTDTFERVALGVYQNDTLENAQQAFEAMDAGLWMPGGRIIAGAGTEKRVTLMNCYVNRKMEDSLDDIMAAVSDAALTQQQGGGIGTDFSTLRPAGALLQRTRAQASGPIPFMDMWHSMCATIMSAGDRRGAMMGTLSDTHPDLPQFIVAKQVKGRLTNFNVSVLVSDAFMEAVREDEEWLLHFPVKPKYRDAHLQEMDFIDDDGTEQFVYSSWRAKDLWNLIIKNTYEWSEPGIIFIDRINSLNNLKYCEEIHCTNPCVTGNTFILTDKGHLPIRWLANEQVNIWNGFEWSQVIPFSTGENQTYKVRFSNGATVNTTAYHKWVMRDGSKLTTSQLESGQELGVHEFPVVIDGADFNIDAYSQGFYSGDGTKNSEHSNLYKHGEGIKNRLVGKFWNRNHEAQPGVRWVHGEMLPKDFVPITANISYCINWLAGLLDADGNIARPQKDTMLVLQITAKDRAFLERIRLMLTRLGVNARFWERKDAGLKYGSNGKQYMCESTACLMISGKGAYQLVELGLKTERVDLTWVRKPQGIARKGVKVLSVDLGTKEETFCLTEPKRGTFIANGVLTHNCGEQPLPPNATCNLGAINLAKFVLNPFQPNAEVNWPLLSRIAKLGMRFLDNVIDVTRYPLEVQRDEEFAKRRTGLGVSGLADALAQLGLRYGSATATAMTERIMSHICLAAYEAPKFLGPLYLQNSFAGLNLSEEYKSRIRKTGMRNGVLLTVAPTGTTSILYGNISSGIEPVFAHQAERQVRQQDDTYKKYTAYGYNYLLYHASQNAPVGSLTLPDYMVTADDLSIEDHVTTQAAVQRWVDASVSKTINVAEKTSFAEFTKVYDLAWALGCKGCTTYRPSEVRGSILSKVGTGTPTSQAVTQITKRSEILSGITHRIHWPSLTAALYITINFDGNQRPFEVFFNSKDARQHDWMTALSLMITAILRKGDDPGFIANELGTVASVHDTAWIKVSEKSEHFMSLIAYIGFILGKYFKPTALGNVMGESLLSTVEEAYKERCPHCLAPSLIRKEGCKTCLNCGSSDCG